MDLINTARPLGWPRCAGKSAIAGARLLPDATQLMVIKAKIFSPLSGGTRNAPGFDQAARNVACITRLLARANRNEQANTKHLLQRLKQCTLGA